MNPHEARELLGAWATNALTKSERDAILGAAIADQEFFNELMEEEEMRIALDDDVFRDRLRTKLVSLGAGKEPSPWRIRFGLHWLTAVSVAAALIVVILIGTGNLSENSTLAGVALGPGTIPALHAVGLLKEQTVSEQRFDDDSRTAPPPSAKGANVELDRTGRNPSYRIGDRQRIGFSVPEDSTALLLEDRLDGSTVRLFPNRFSSSPHVPAGQTILVPPAGQGDLAVEGLVGQRKLRLLIFPSSVDPANPAADWQELRKQSKTVEKRYEVK
jgi:hypothetical protein